MNFKEKILIPLANFSIKVKDFYKEKTLVASLSTLGIVALLGVGIFFIIDKDNEGDDMANVKTEEKASFSLNAPDNKSQGVKFTDNIGGNVQAKENDIVIGGDTLSEEESKLKSLEKHIQNLDYKELAVTARAKGNTLEGEDAELKKWITRLYMISKIQQEEISDEELVKTAKAAKERRAHFFNFVKHAYSINPSNEEITKYIDEKAPNSPETAKIAEGLNLTVKQLNYEYDADQYKQQLVWDKLLPILKEKTPKNNTESEAEYLERIDKIFNEALDSYIKAL